MEPNGGGKRNCERYFALPFCLKAVFFIRRAHFFRYFSCRFFRFSLRIFISLRFFGCRSAAVYSLGAVSTWKEHPSEALSYYISISSCRIKSNCRRGSVRTFSPQARDNAELALNCTSESKNQARTEACNYL